MIGRLEDLRRFQISDGVALAHDLRRRLEEIAPESDAGNSFAFLLVDGLFGTKKRWRMRFRKGWARSRWSEARRATA